jgi:glycopeptide antibiotics resistance protein
MIQFLRKRSHPRLLFVSILEFYLLLLFSVVILPIRILPPALLEKEGQLADYLQLIPFRTISRTLKDSGVMSIQIIGNILLLLPLPILLGCMGKKSTFSGLLVRCFLVSAGIEILQLCIDIVLKYPSRTFDVDDLILNTFGIVIGIGIFKQIGKIRKPNL